MAWRPLYDNHAIDRVRVICAFQADLRPKFVNRLGSFLDEEAKQFGFNPLREVKAQGIKLQLAPSGQVNPKTEEVTGWVYERTRSDGSVAEFIGLENGSLTFETSEYSSWSKLFQKVTSLTARMIEELTTYADMSVLILEYQDRFVFEGPVENADPRHIFKLPADAMTIPAWDAGNLWHLHRGWFEKCGDGQLLVNQNLDAQDGEFNGTPARSVAVVTKVEARASHMPLSPGSLTNLLPEMHTQSNNLLKAILTPDAVQMIGMN